MFKQFSWLILALFVAIGSINLVGCQQQGPLEEAAEEIEDEIDDATDAR